MRSLKWLALALMAVLGGAAAAQAQVSPSQLIDAARRQLDELNPDSAASLLRYAVDPRTGAGLRDRLRGLTLLGIADLVSGRRAEARQAFREALRLDRDLRVDSLADLHSDLLSTFNAEKTALVRETGLALVLEVPTDTSVPVRGGGFRVGVLPTRRASVTLTITDQDGLPVFSDSQLVSGFASFDWSIRTASGAPVEPGRYRLRVAARDSTGAAALDERTLVIEREPLDTVPLPAPLPPSAFASETIGVRQRTLGPLVRGLLFGAGAGLLTYAGPGPGGSLDSRTWIVGGAVAAAGVAGYFGGRRVSSVDSAAIDANRRLRQRFDESRAATIAANERARERARIRIRSGSRSP